MEKITLIVFTAFCCTIFNAEAQDTSVNWGAKAGANYSSYWDRIEMDGAPGFDYSAQPGFFVGAFVNTFISEKFELQPELLFSYRSTKLDGRVNYIIDPMDPTGYRYKATLTEFTLDLPVMIRYSFLNSLFLEAGPQLGYILNRKEEVEESPFDNRNHEPPFNDKFDAGIAAGFGVKLISGFKFNARYFTGLVKRENMISSSVINLGVEYIF